MAKLAERIEDKRLLRLIRSFLQAGVMEDGLVQPVDEGTPQGGPLSPLLSNIVLDELDRELEKRGLRLVRYADDCNIICRQPTRRTTGHDQRNGMAVRQTQAYGEPIQECGRAAMGAEISWLQLHENRRTKTAHSAESGGPVQGAGAGDYAPDAGH